MSDEDESRRLDERVRQLGLPTDPAAYQDGGLVTGATARTVGEAEIIAAYLKDHDIPAWVGAPLASLGYAQYLPSSVSVLVPLGRLADAQATLKARQSQTDLLSEPLEDIAVDEVGDPLLRRSRTLAFLAIWFPLSLFCLFHAIHLVVRIRRAERQTGSSPPLEKAFRWALFTATVAIIASAVGGYLLIELAATFF